MSQDEHPYSECSDEYCLRFPCVVFKEGFELGYGAGYSAGYSAGEADGYDAGFSAGASSCGCGG